MLASLGLFGSAMALIAVGWLTVAGWVFVWPGASPRTWLIFTVGCVCAILLALVTFYIAVKPLHGVGISGGASASGDTGGADLMAHLAVRFYVAFVVVILTEVGLCALITTLTRRTA